VERNHLKQCKHVLEDQNTNAKIEADEDDALNRCREVKLEKIAILMKQFLKMKNVEGKSIKFPN